MCGRTPGADSRLGSQLRSETATQVQGVKVLLHREVPKLKRASGRARIRVRLDAGFATPMIFALLEELKIQYVVGISKNSVLASEIETQMDFAELDAEDSGETTRYFTRFYYAARSWPRLRRVVAKAEALVHEERDLKRNMRFVVTNLRHRPEMDRTSCTSFRANAFRVLQTTAAYALFQELRWRLRRTKLRNAQVGTLRLRLLKIGVRIKVSVRRIVVHGPKHWPWGEVRPKGRPGAQYLCERSE